MPADRPVVTWKATATRQSVREPSQRPPEVLRANRTLFRELHQRQFVFWLGFLGRTVGGLILGGKGERFSADRIVGGRHLGAVGASLCRGLAG